MILSKTITNSSQLTKVTYDTVRKELTVTFVKGTKYKYSNVPDYTVDELLNAVSIGSYFMKNIAKKFKFEKVG